MIYENINTYITTGYTSYMILGAGTTNSIMPISQNTLFENQPTTSDAQIVNFPIYFEPGSV